MINTNPTKTFEEQVTEIENDLKDLEVLQSNIEETKQGINSELVEMDKSLTDFVNALNTL